MAKEIGIDLGTSKTVLFSGAKIVLELPSVVTVDSETWEPVYYGEKALQTLGRTPDSLTCVRPIERGVISDYEIAQQMMRRYMTKAFGNKIIRPRVMAALPTGLTEVQHRSVANVIEAAGGRNVSVIEGPVAVAIGLGIDFSKPHGSMIVDIGAGTTDIATLSMGGIAQCSSVKIASGDFDELIMRAVRKEYNVVIGPLTAEHIKKQIGTVVSRPVEIAMTAKGRNLFSGLPQSFEITSSEVFEAIGESANSICNEVRKVLEKTDPDLVADILEDGIYLTGGGSLIHGMDTLLSEYIGTKVIPVDDPTHSVVKGTGIALKNPKLLRNVDFQYRSIQELIVD